MIVRFAFFVFFMVGYADLFRNRFKMNRRLTWVFTFSAITLVLYLAALFNALLPAVYGICGLGAILSMYQIWRYMTKKDSIRGLDFTALAMLLYLLLLVQFYCNRHCFTLIISPIGAVSSNFYLSMIAYQRNKILSLIFTRILWEVLYLFTSLPRLSDFQKVSCW